jgi:hypothetical protein
MACARAKANGFTQTAQFMKDSSRTISKTAMEVSGTNQVKCSKASSRKVTSMKENWLMYTTMSRRSNMKI